MMQKKLKVVILCHFSNYEIRNIVRTHPGRLLICASNFFKNDFAYYIKNDFAPWVSNLIKEFESMDNVELHVISPISYLSNDIFEIEKRNVFYHFFRGNLSFPFDKIVSKIRGAKRRFSRNKKLVTFLIKKINPDIINLIGTENPYYSSTILNINNIPIFVTVQTVYTNPNRLKLTENVLKLNWNVELEIHKKVKYYGCAGRMHRDLILSNNPNAIILKTFLPIEVPVNVIQEKKIYDFISFSQGISDKKGAIDAIEALYIVRKKYSNVKLNFVGHFDDETDFGQLLLKKIRDLNLTENIIFTPYFSKHSDMLQHTQKSRFALLPVKLDMIPSTVIEAILLELPVITYKTSGTPYINKDGECILISEIGDIEALAFNMLKFIESPEIANYYKIKAKDFIIKTFDNTLSTKRLIDSYYAVIENYYKNSPIPEELLFDLKEFPIY